MRTSSVHGSTRHKYPLGTDSFIYTRYLGITSIIFLFSPLTLYLPLTFFLSSNCFLRLPILNIIGSSTFNSIISNNLLVGFCMWSLKCLSTFICIFVAWGVFRYGSTSHEGRGAEKI